MALSGELDGSPLFLYSRFVTPPAKTPPAAERWKCLQTHISDPDANGNLGMHFALQDQDGNVFVVSVDGPINVTGESFVLALRAAQARILAAAGGKFDPAHRLSKSH